MTSKIDLLKLNTGTTGISTSNIYKDSNDILQYDSASEGLHPLSSVSQTCIIVDEKGETEQGGSITANTDTTRDLNTVRSSQVWASLATNTITIHGDIYPGVYLFKWKTPGYLCSEFVSWITDGTSVTFGSPHYTVYTEVPAESFGVHAEEITTEKDYNIVMRARVTRATIGLGQVHENNAANDNNVYTQVIIQKIS